MKSYLYGIKKAIPVIFGFLPVAVTFAIMSVGAGLTPLETVLMSVFVFAGASQIMAVGMIGTGAGVVSIVITAFVLNLRHVIMSTCVFKRIHTKNVFQKMLGALSITDEGFALVTTEDEKHSDFPFLLGVITVTYLSWIAGTVIGVFASEILPRIVADSFGIALYALFLALIVPNVKGNFKLLLTVIITAVINSVLYTLIGSSWAVIASTVLGALLGTFIVGDSTDNSPDGTAEETA